MAKAKSASKEATPEEQLAQAGYSTATAHGVDEDHPDETVEEWSERIKENPEEAVKEQQDKAAEEQAAREEESGSGGETGEDLGAGSAGAEEK